MRESALFHPVQLGAQNAPRRLERPSPAVVLYAGGPRLLETRVRVAFVANHRIVHGGSLTTAGHELLACASWSKFLTGSTEVYKKATRAAKDIEVSGK